MLSKENTQVFDVCFFTHGFISISLPELSCLCFKSKAMQQRDRMTLMHVFTQPDVFG